MIFTGLLPSANWSMVLSRANITNGKLHVHGPSIHVMVNLTVTVKSFSLLSPYIIGTSNQPVKMIANHGLHLSFRLVKGTVGEGLSLMFWLIVS